MCGCQAANTAASTKKADDEDEICNEISVYNENFICNI